MPNNPGLITSRIASGAILKHRIVKDGAADNTALQASAPADASIGVSTDIDTAIGKVVDVIRSGVAPLEYGGPVTRGLPLTADAEGRGVAAAPAAGANVRIIGFAEVSGVLGDIGAVFIAPSVMQG